MKLSKSFVGSITVVAILLVGFYYILYFSSDTYSDSNKFDSTNIEMSIPDGWYQHSLNDNSILLLTRQEVLPEIGTTELYAYGEQISISEFPIDTPPRTWVEQKTYIDLDDVLVLKSEWSNVNGYELLTVEREAAGATGKVMDKYLFTDSTVHIFSLYPLESYNLVSEEQKRNLENVSVLEQILNGYVMQL